MVSTATPPTSAHDLLHPTFRNMSQPPRRPFPTRHTPTALTHRSTGSITLRTNAGRLAALPYSTPSRNAKRPRQTSHVPASDPQLINDSNKVGPGHDIYARPYVCQFQKCDRAFARKSDLVRHLRIHTNDRPFICLYQGCGKSFIQRSALTVHTRVHTGERPHHCEICMKAFADSSSLARHRRVHTGKRPYACKIAGCGRAFARRNTYVKHFRRTHPDQPLPAASSVLRNTPQIPVYMTRAPDGSFVPSGPLSSTGRYHVPASASHPHFVAAPYPSEGAAYAGHGGHCFPGAAHGNFRPNFFQGSQGGSPATRQPLSATVSYHSLQSPGTVDPNTMGNEPHTVATPITSNQGGNGGPVGHLQYPGGSQTRAPFSQYPIARFASDGAVTFFKTEPSEPRSVSDSASQPPRFQAYTPISYNGGIGGFQPGQLALPPQHMAHLQPSYLSPPFSLPSSQGRGQRLSLSSDTPSLDYDRGSSPEALVDINSMPSINYYSLNGGGPAFVPHSATQASQFNPLTHGPPQIMTSTTPQPDRLHSAPPMMQRFNSMPAVPSVPGWSLAGPYTNGHRDAQSTGDRRNREEEEWEELQEQMLSREASDGGKDSEEGADSGVKKVSHEEEASQTATPEKGWINSNGRASTSQNMLSSGASSSSASSTLVATSLDSLPMTQRPPISIYPQHTHHMGFTPYYPHGFYPIPLTPADANPGWLAPEPSKCDSQCALTLTTNAPDLLPRPYVASNYTDQSRNESEGDCEHSITLTTPAQLGRRDSSDVATVGLGLANVQFDEREAPVPAACSSGEGEEELESDFDMERLDESNGEFVLGSKKRAVNAKKAKKTSHKSGIKATRRK